MKAARDNAAKPRLVSNLVWFKHALEGLSAHMDAGRAKYPDVENEHGDLVPNFTLGGKPDAEYIDAIARHAFRIAEGEVYDPETGTKHTAAIMWNAAALDSLNQSDYPAVNPATPMPSPAIAPSIYHELPAETQALYVHKETGLPHQPLGIYVLRPRPAEEVVERTALAQQEYGATVGRADL